MQEELGGGCWWGKERSWWCQVVRLGCLLMQTVDTAPFNAAVANNKQHTHLPPAASTSCLMDSFSYLSRPVVVIVKPCAHSILLSLLMLTARGALLLLLLSGRVSVLLLRSPGAVLIRTDVEGRMEVHCLVGEQQLGNRRQRKETAEHRSSTTACSRALLLLLCPCCCPLLRLQTMIAMTDVPEERVCSTPCFHLALGS